MHARLLYVMDPMCSWCWGFAPVLESLAEQAAAAGVSLQLVLGGLRRDGVAIDAAARVRYLGYWQAVNASTWVIFLAMFTFSKKCWGITRQLICRIDSSPKSARREQWPATPTGREQ